MSAPRERWAKLLSLFKQRAMDRDIDAELASHLEMAIEENVARGLSPAEAERRALIGLGGMTAAREMHREARGLPWIENLWRDLRYALRGMRRDLGFTVFAVLIAGLGIGASCTVFSVVNAVLLRPLPFTDPARLAWIANAPRTEGLSAQTVQSGQLLDLLQYNRSFEDIAGYFAFYGVGDTRLGGDGPPERLSELPVSRNFFPLLGVKPAIGRLFSDDEAKWNGPKAVLLSHQLWARRFASDRNIVGKAITLEETQVTVIGVLPESFDFASVFAPGMRFDLYTAFPLSPETNRWGNTLALVGRLRPGVSLEAADGEVRALSQQINAQHKGWNTLSLHLSSLAEHVGGHLRAALQLLAFAVGVVMLIVCANLSNLLLARSTARQREMAVRVALGAGRGRLIGQTLTESFVLAAMGALLGLALAAGGIYLLSHLDSVNVPLLGQLRLDGGALAFTVVASILTGLLFGAVPAMQAPGLALHDALKDNGRGTSEGRSRAGVRAALVVMEIAFACVLVVAAGLLARSFLRVLDVKLGFDPGHTATIRIDPSSKYKTQTQQNAYFTEALRLARGIPGVEAAGLTDSLPLGRNRTWGVRAKDKVYTKDESPLAFVRISSDGYLKSMGIALRAGRDFSANDVPGQEPVVIVNQTMANVLWPGEGALGKLLAFGQGDRRVIGVVDDVKHMALEQSSGNEMYLPIRQTKDYASVDLVVRTTLAPAQLASGVREALRPVEPNLPANEFRTLRQLVDKSTSPRRLIVLLLAGFAAFALVLASLGIYAVISYSVSQRKREIGIRMALGESAAGVQWRILKQTMKLAGIGMLLGSAAAWALARGFSGLLFGVTANDPVTFVGMLAAIGAVAGLAGYLPARRAARIDPAVALRAG